MSKPSDNKMSSPGETGLRQRKPNDNGTSTGEYTEKYVQAIADKAPANLQPYIKQAAPIIGFLAGIIFKSIPFFVFIFNKCSEIWVSLSPYKPELLFPAFAGLIMCFFGGTFLTLIAAFEAYRMCGWEQSAQCLKDLNADFKKFKEDNKVDDTKDENNDGVADVLQISSSDLATRKVLLFCRSVEPNRMGAAIAGLNAGFLAVVATLKLQFAMSITLGVSIGKILDVPAKRLCVPAIEFMLPAEYKKWAVPAVEWTVKSISISMAWFLQRVISAFHSALRGGVMFSRNIMEYLSVMKYVEISHADTYIDEVIGFGLAAIGFWFQLSSGFSLFFPLNLLLLPFSILEYMLMWIVNSK